MGVQFSAYRIGLAPRVVLLVPSLPEISVVCLYRLDARTSVYAGCMEDREEDGGTSGEGAGQEGLSVFE